MVIYVFVSCAVALIILFVGGSMVIGDSARQECTHAQAEYGGDCVEALIALLEDENAGYRKRNSAVWALGQYGDSRALPVLEQYYTGSIPDREPLDASISQYELQKAINLAGGAPNITAWLWR